MTDDKQPVKQTDLVPADHRELQTVAEPGTYWFNDETYHADPCYTPSLSAGVAHVLLTKTALHAREAHPRLNPTYTEEHDKKYDKGSAVHAMILGGRDIVSVQANAWRSNDAKEQRDRIYAEGGIPLLAHQYDECAAVAEQAVAAIKQHPDVSLDDGVPEACRFWQSEQGTWCRDKPDFLLPNGDIIDLKFTAIGPRGWAKHAVNMGYDVRVGHYREGSRQLCDNDDAQYLFVNIETTAPHQIYVTAFDAEWLSVCDEKARHARALWRTCLDSGDWPGYRQAIHYVEMPAWNHAEWEEQRYLAGDNGSTEFLEALGK